MTGKCLYQTSCVLVWYKHLVLCLNSQFGEAAAYFYCTCAVCTLEICSGGRTQTQTLECKQSVIRNGGLEMIAVTVQKLVTV